MEGVNARYLELSAFPTRPSFATADVSFISLTKILPAVSGVLADGSDIVTLIKPQFEAGRNQVGKGGVVRDAPVHARVQAALRTFAEEELGWTCEGMCVSPLKGPAGNTEFLAHWRKPAGCGT